MICKWIGVENNAATKATNDVNFVFRSFGGELILLWKHNLKVVRNIEEVITYRKLKHTLTVADNLFVQWPLYSIKPYSDNLVFSLPHKKIICFIQDIESYRYHPDNDIDLKKDIQYLNNFDVVIAHNRGMIEFLKEHNLTTKIVDWQICDYIISKPKRDRFYRKYVLCYIGNFDRSKFLQINDKNFQTKINLYGQMSDKFSMNKQLTYKGIYNPDNNDCQLEGCFGLIWEGNRIDLCDTNFGNYMKINNPNRLSLYLANNMPVIIWEKAGVADFVKKNKIGFTVKRLSEIDGILASLSREKYFDMVNNAKQMGEAVRSGAFARQAIKNAINGKYVER
jgi:hypothetical protein